MARRDVSRCIFLPNLAVGGRTAMAGVCPDCGKPGGAQTAKSGECGKVLPIAVVVVGLLAALGIGGFAYLAYRAKKKVDEVRQTYKENNLEKIAGALGGKGAAEGETREVGAMPSYPEYTPGT